MNLIVMEELIHMLNFIQPLSAGLESHLRSIIRQHLFRKGDFLLRIGEVSRDILFLREGLVRSCYPLRNEDVSNWFMKEGDICISILSFLEQEPAVDNIVALEDCECWGITYTELQACYRLFPEFNFHGRMITSKYYCWSERRHLAILRQTPEDKYDNLCQTDPELVQRVPSKHLATFLNVGIRTLHTIRKDARIRMKRARKG